MWLAAFKGALTGLLFGMVLYKVGASRYSRVMGMLTVRDTKVMKFTFVTIATASFIYGLADIFGFAESWHLVPRIMPYMGASHIIGGVLFGATLGWVGFCPGTCWAKAGGMGGDKKFTALSSILGLLAGILIYNFFKESMMSNGIIATEQKPLTLHGVLGLSYGAAAITFGAIFLLIAVLIDRGTTEKFFTPSIQPKAIIDWIRGEWSWMASGVLAGILITAATMQDGYLGFSGALLALVGWFSHLVGFPIASVPVINQDILWRAFLIIGVFPGGLLARAISTKSFAEVNFKGHKVFSLPAIIKSFVGGIGLSLGAMIGGGCTTGAYLAAWPTLSVGSLLMGATFFASSMIVANSLLWLRKINIGDIQNLGDKVCD
ncbi:MAG: hypothetical protein RJB66_389 [Pseudomonadota bacterium]|jgi:hypothetical protein